jgi:hypothetical protein
MGIEAGGTPVGMSKWAPGDDYDARSLRQSVRSGHENRTIEAVTDDFKSTDLMAEP